MGVVTILVIQLLTIKQLGKLKIRIGFIEKLSKGPCTRRKELINVKYEEKVPSERGEKYILNS